MLILLIQGGGVQNSGKPAYIILARSHERRNPNSGCQSLHIIMLTYQFILRNVKKEISMPPNRKFTSFLHQKAVYSPLDFSLTLKFCLYPYPPNYKCKGLPFHQILNEWQYQKQLYLIIQNQATSPVMPYCCLFQLGFLF